MQYLSVLHGSTARGSAIGRLPWISLILIYGHVYVLSRIFHGSDDSKPTIFVFIEKVTDHKFSFSPACDHRKTTATTIITMTTLTTTIRYMHVFTHIPLFLTTAYAWVHQQWILRLSISSFSLNSSISRVLFPTNDSIGLRWSEKLFPFDHEPNFWEATTPVTLFAQSTPLKLCK